MIWLVPRLALVSREFTLSVAISRSLLLKNHAFEGDAGTPRKTTTPQNMVIGPKTR